MTVADLLVQGRKAFAQQEWASACARLAEADSKQSLEPQDLERLAAALYLVGRDAESGKTWARAHRELLNQGNVERAARCAFWLASQLMNYGERVRSRAWITRATRLLEENRRDCVELGYLLLSVALQSFLAGDPNTAYVNFSQAEETGKRFGDPDLIALARHSRGRILIRLGEVQKGISLLDEAMVAVEARELSPIVVGDVYCSVIEGCLEVFDLRRAQEWTTALTHWCDSQPDLVPYRGQCLVRRAEILQLHGGWREAAEAAQLACDRLLDPPHPASAVAFYWRGELHRLRGSFAEAEEAYRQASRRGRNPQPGFALLRFLEGRTDAAGTAIRLALDETQDTRARARLLPAYVEIMLAAGDVAAADLAAEELTTISASLDAQLLKAQAGQAGGAVLLAKGEARTALSVLRQAWMIWQEIDAPYEAARVRILIGLACRDLGDDDAAEMEFDAARWLFEHLGARPDLGRLEKLTRSSGGDAAAGLTARELEILRLVAAGKSNRVIGDELFISERTVERHVSNIFNKIDVSSRAAATAYAYKHKIL